MRTTNRTRMLAVALVGALLTPAAADVARAQGAGDPRDAFIYRHYQNNRPDADYRDWRRGRWNDEDYRRWYRRNNRSSSGDAAAAAIFGLAIGGLLGGAIGGATGSTVAPRVANVPPAGGYAPFTRGYVTYCSNKYRSFDPNSGTFLGYDGQRHYCR